ncbi:MAG: hypothetical protein AAFN70_18925, partial [Planctomycetota bacterium]
VVTIDCDRDDTIIYYDHHEDGYTADVVNGPHFGNATATTEVWGDGDISNGAAPGVTSDAADVLNAGDIIILENVVDPNSPETNAEPGKSYDFDARDRLLADKGIVITRAGWSVVPGPVLAGTVEVADTSKWGANYTIPVGEDTNLPSIYQYVGAYVLALEDNTRIEIDVDADGTINTAAGDVSIVLNQGQEYHVDGGIQQGATITAFQDGNTSVERKVQVNLITGDRDSSVDSRWYRIRDRDSWDSAYLSAVGTTSTTAPASIVVYNPHSTALNVQFQTTGGIVTRSVAAGQTFVETLALETTASGARVSSTDGRDFYAVLAMDTDTDTVTYDWGFSLLGADQVTEMVVVGYGRGTQDNSGNGSPAWIMAQQATTLYI